MKLVMQINQKFVEADTNLKFGPGVISITPPLDEDYWLMRVPVSKTQALVCFPKFGTVGIGFQHEEDWNTNLPYTCEAEEIYNHIQHNRGNRHIAKAACLEAIRLLQSAIAKMGQAARN